MVALVAGKRPGRWDYVYINDKHLLLGRHSCIDYGNSEEHGERLGYGANLEIAISLGYYFVSKHKLETAPRISEKLHVPLKLVS